MVTITGCKEHSNQQGNAFVLLELHGGVEIVQSQATGKFYATARKCFMSCTFDISVAQKLVGSSLPGNISRVECMPYQYTVPNTGEIVMLNYRYEYIRQEEKSPTVDPSLKGKEIFFSVEGGEQNL